MSNNARNKLITSALPYVNNTPHLGNIVGCVLSSDVYARFCKKMGYNTVHICGTDEYGTAIEMAALESGKHPQEICDMNHTVHKDIYDWFEIEFDYFGRTTERSHAVNTVEFFKRADANGFLEEQESEQLYCEGCRIFLADRYVEGDCPQCRHAGARGDQCEICSATFRPTELINPACSLCRAPPVTRPTTHIFLRLDLLQSQLEKLTESRMDGWSHNAKEITKEWIRKDLHPRCITRDLKFRWGVPVPKPGFEEKVLYVWFDAPIAYISFTKAFLQERYGDFMSNCTLYQFMGKDNVPFHSIFFPGMCLASDTSFLVDVISSTEYLLFENKKFSKSKRVGIFGSDLTDGGYGEASLWRYYLMKIRPESKDSNFTFQDFRSSVVGDLINNIGNFCNRVLRYVESTGGVVQYSVDERARHFIARVNELYARYLAQMEAVELKHGVKTILDVSGAGNEYIQGCVSGPKEARDSSFCIAVSLVLYLGHMLEPFMPKVSRQIFQMLCVDGGAYPQKFELVKCGKTIGRPIQPLFRPFSDAELGKMGNK